MIAFYFYYFQIRSILMNQEFLNSYNSLPSMHLTTYSTLENSHFNQTSQGMFRRQRINAYDPAQGPLLQREYHLQPSENHQTYQNMIKAPTMFNTSSPTQLKIKKASLRPLPRQEKVPNNGFDRQIEDEYFKNDKHLLPKDTLQQFSKTTSTFVGNLPQNNTSIENRNQNSQSSQKQYPNMRANTQFTQKAHKLRYSNSFSRLDNRSVVESSLINRLDSNILKYNDYSKEQHYQKDSKCLLQQISNQKKTIQLFQDQVIKLNSEIRTLKSNEQMMRNELEQKKNNRNQSMPGQPWLQAQNYKLLEQIQSLQSQIKGKNDLNRFLQHRCNDYLEKFNTISKELNTYKEYVEQQNKKNIQIVDILKTQVKDLELEVKTLKQNQEALFQQNLKYKKLIQSHLKKIEEQQKNTEVDRSEINVLLMKLETYQGKHQNHISFMKEAEARSLEFQDAFKKEKENWSEHEKKMTLEKAKFQQKEKILNWQVSQLKKEVDLLNEQVSTISRERQEIRSQYQEQTRKTKEVQIDKQQQKVDALKRQKELWSENEQIINLERAKLQEKARILTKENNQLKIQNANLKQLSAEANLQKQTLKNKLEEQAKMARQQRIRNATNLKKYLLKQSENQQSIILQKSKHQQRQQALSRQNFELSQEIKALNNQMMAVNKENMSIKNSYEQLLIAMQSIKANKLQDYEQILSSERQKRNQAEKRTAQEIINLQDRERTLKIENNQLSSQLSQLQSKQQALTQSNNQLISKIASSNDQIVSVTREKQTIISIFEDKIQSIQLELSKLTKESDKLNIKCSNFKVENTQLTEAYQAVASENNQLRSQIQVIKQQAKQSHNHFSSKLDQCRSQFNRCSQEKGQLQTLLSEKQHLLDLLSISLKQKQSECLNLTHKAHQKLAVAERMISNELVKDRQTQLLSAQLQQKTNNIELLVKNIHEITQEHEHTSSELSHLKQSHHQLEQKLKFNANNYEALNSEYNRQLSQLKEFQSLLIGNRKEYQCLQFQYKQICLKTEEQIQKYKRLKQSYDELEGIHSQLIESSCRYQTSKNDLNSRYQTIKSQYQELERRYENTKVQSQRQLLMLQKQKKDWQNRFINLFQQKGKIESKYNTASHQQINLEQQIEQLRVQNRHLLENNQRNEKVNNQLSNINKQLSDKQRQQAIQNQYLRSSLADKEKYLQNLLIEIEYLKRQNQSFKQFIKAHEKDKMNYKQKLNNLERQNKSLIEKNISYQQNLAKHEEKMKQGQSEQSNCIQRYRAQIDSMISIIEGNQHKHTAQLLRYDQKYQIVNKQLKQLKKIREDDIKYCQNQQKSSSEKLETLVQEIQTLRYDNEQKRMKIQQLEQNLSRQLARQELNQSKNQSQVDNSFNRSHEISSPLKSKNQSILNRSGQEISYMEVDGEGILYLCSLLQIQTKNGNLLNQIVDNTVALLEDLERCKKIHDYYQEVLELFEIQHLPNCQEQLLVEINGFKENLAIILEKLREEEQKCENLRMNHSLTLDSKQVLETKFRRLLNQQHGLIILNQELNEQIVILTIKLSNQRVQMMEAMKIASQNKENSSSCSIRVEQKFVTAQSFHFEDEKKQKGEVFQTANCLYLEEEDEESIDQK